MHAPDRPQPYAHPARLILILSLAPTIGLGIGRFAYALVLPDMRDSLGWSYSAAGFLNTVNAAGYLGGALVAAAIVKRNCRHSGTRRSRGPGIQRLHDRDSPPIAHRSSMRSLSFRAGPKDLTPDVQLHIGESSRFRVRAGARPGMTALRIRL